MKASIRFLLIITFCFFNYQTWAGNVRGVLIDAITNEQIISATIFLEGTSFITQSGLDGTFILRNVPSGNYKLLITYVGYKSIAFDISVRDTEDLQLGDLALLQEKTNLTEVVVHGTEDKTTDEFSKRSIQNSERIVNMVSAKSIEMSPDITVANVIQRVSGISIERNSNGDGQHAIIRGMDKRYNYTLVNGVKIPSPDDKYRYVPLDIFPAELLDRLEVSKSLTPNMEGDAVGGAINMVMKDAPNSLYINASVSTGFSELFANRSFKSFDTKQINFKSPYEIYGKSYIATPKDFPLKRYNFNSGHPPLNLIGGFAMGNRFFKSKFGVVLAGSYQNTYRGSNSLFFDSNINVKNPNYYLSDRNERTYDEQQTRYGLHLKADFKLNLKNKIQLYSAYLNLSNSQFRDVKSIGLSNGYDPINGNANLGFSQRSRLTVQQIYNSTLQGDHSVTSRFKINWSGVYSIATSNVPDNTSINFLGARTANVDKINFLTDATQEWQRNSDRDLAAYLNLNYTVDVFSLPVDLAIGGLYRDKQRENFKNTYQFYPLQGFINYGTDFTDIQQVQWRLQNPKGSVANALTHNAYEYIQAGYFQFKFKVFRTQFIGGVRAESTRQGYKLEFPLGELRPFGEQNYVDFLPSLHLKYMPTSKVNIWASYFRAINRPGFMEIIPSRQIFEEYVERGNPDLKRAVIDNLDMRLEYFPKNLDQFMIGFFYKNLKNPIEYTIRPDQIRAQDQFYTPGNFGTAINYGFELDMIKYFNWFGIKANYTFTQSNITTSKQQKLIDESGNEYTESNVQQSRPLYGQSAHIGNLSFLVKDVKNGFNAQLAASYTGERINTISQYLNNDFWQDDFIQVDASVEKSFKKFTFFCKANNLLDTPFILFIKNTNPQNTDVADSDYKGKTLIRKDYYQRAYQVGLRFKL